MISSNREFTKVYLKQIYFEISIVLVSLINFGRKWIKKFDAYRNDDDDAKKKDDDASTADRMSRNGEINKERKKEIKNPPIYFLYQV